jgi:hypothetical protein
MRGELRALAEELCSLQQNLSATAELRPVEPYVTLKFCGDGKGHINVRGDACSRLGSETHLVFELDIDQTYLKRIIDALAAGDPLHETRS